MSASNWQNLLQPQNTVCKGVVGMWCISFPTSTSGKKVKWSWDYQFTRPTTVHLFSTHCPNIAFYTSLIFRAPIATMLNISNYLSHQQYFTSLQKGRSKVPSVTEGSSFSSHCITFPPWYPVILAVH